MRIGGLVRVKYPIAALIVLFLGLASSVQAQSGITRIASLGPVAEPIAGTYSAELEVALSSYVPATILYTLDGTIPACQPQRGTLYIAPIEISSTKTLKAVACYGYIGTFSSFLSTFTYSSPLSTLTYKIAPIVIPMADVMSGIADTLVKASPAVTTPLAESAAAFVEAAADDIRANNPQKAAVKYQQAAAQYRAATAKLPKRSAEARKIPDPALTPAQNAVLCARLATHTSVISRLYSVDAVFEGLQGDAANAEASINASALGLRRTHALVECAKSFAALPAVTTGAASAAPSMQACIDLSRRLALNDTDATTVGEVSRLQRFLARDASIYPEGLVTGFFGLATQRAIQRWQAQSGIVSSGNPDSTGYGAVGPSTRTALSCRRPEAPAVSIRQPIIVPASQQSAPQNQSAQEMQRPTPTVATLPASPTGVDSGDITVTGASAPSTSPFSASATSGAVPFPVTFTYTLNKNSSCAAGFYRLSFGDENWAAGDQFQNPSWTSGICAPSTQTITHTYTKPGSYRAELNNPGIALLGSATIYVVPGSSVAPRSCTFNGQSIAHGSSVSAYQSSSVAYGSQCAQQTRLCSNGTLSGSYTYASCTASAPVTTTPTTPPPSGTTTLPGTSSSDIVVADANSGTAPLTVTFRYLLNRTASCSAGSYRYAFGDEDWAAGDVFQTASWSANTCTQSIQTVTHVYTKVGTYKMSMYDINQTTGAGVDAGSEIITVTSPTTSQTNIQLSNLANALVALQELLKRLGQ